MHHSHLADPSGAYSRVPVSIFIASESLWVLCSWWAEYWGVCFKARRSMSLYKLLITLVQSVTVFGNLTPIRAIFSLGFRDSTS